MATVFDAAQYILELHRRDDALPITTWKLQKLAYYSQAWSLVWDDAALFEEDFQAWANGPVCYELYAEHRGRFKIATLDQGDARELSDDQKETIEVVYGHYGPKTPQYLSELTHREGPWMRARDGLSPGERSTNVITLDLMAEYYGGL